MIFIIKIILIFVAVALGFFSFKVLAKKLDTLCDEMEYFNDLDFNRPPPDSLISRKYLNVTVLCRFVPAEQDEVFTQMVDTSLYLKKNIIALTIPVQKQYFESLRRIHKIDIDWDSFFQKDQIAIIKNCTVYQLINGMWTWQLKEVPRDDD